MYQIGKCNNCGACCYIYSPKLGHFHLCGQYDATKNEHCKLYDKPDRPKECTEFPRGPADLERVKEWCCIKFADEKGRIVDEFMDNRVKLTLIK